MNFNELMQKRQLHTTDGLLVIPWLNGKSLCWDVTVICPLAESYVKGATREAGTAAEIAASRKEAKYSCIDSRFVFNRLLWKLLAFSIPRPAF